MGVSTQTPQRMQPWIRCGVCVETPNPLYAVPEKWKGREKLPLYEKLATRTG